MSLPAAELIANSWTSAAPGYDELFVPRFSPWTSDALEQLFFTAPSLPEGSIIVPTCGPGQELPLVSELLGNGRPIIGIDIAPGMIEIAKRRAAECGAHVSVSVGDCMTLPVGPHAAILSVFGLQQLPDPPAALGNWVGTLAPGGVAVIIFWPMGAGVEAEGPWAHWSTVLKGKLGDGARRGNPGWEDALPAAAEAAGGEVIENRAIAHRIDWPSPAAMWEGMTRSGPWHAQRLSRGDEFVESCREDWESKFEAGKPIVHTPSARLLVVRRRAAA